MSEGLTGAIRGGNLASDSRAAAFSLNIRSAAAHRLVGLVLAVAACACSRGAPNSAGSNFADVEGRTFRRVVSLAPNLTEMMYDAGGGAALVARSQFCDYPAEALVLPTVLGGVNPDLESILAFKPDLILSLQFSAAALPVETLRDAGISVYWARVETARDVIRTVRELGVLSGTAGTASVRADELQREVERLGEWHSDARVLIVHGHRPIVCAGEGSWGDEILRLAGFPNALAGSSSRYPALDMEQILDASPHLVVDTDFSDNSNDLGAFWGQFSPPGSRPGFKVVFLSDPVLLRPGPRMVQAALLLRKQLQNAMQQGRAG